MNQPNPVSPGLWREPQGAVPNSLALSYGVFGNLAGLALLVQSSPWLWIAGVLLTTHSLIVCAYLVHECAHMTLFRSKKINTRVGELLLWMTGAAYASFARIRHIHIRHHRDRADVVCFDYRAFLARLPRWLQQGIYALEWLYIPAIELIMHYQVVLRPFIDPQQASYRTRVVMVLVSRLMLFWLLFNLSPWAIVGYALAYMIMIQALFMADAFAHTYEEYILDNADEPVPGNDRDKAYDMAHTYSNLLSTRLPWLNLFNLNFGYHTAHHEKAGTPWYRLPALHGELFGDTSHTQVLPYRELWHTLHRNRLSRIRAEDYGDVGEGPHRADGFLGVHGVSFLSIV